jgi:hypothetical protein
MFALIRPFLRISLLSAGPEDLPASRLLLGITLVLYALATLAAYWPHYGYAVSAARTGVEMLVLVGYTWGALRWRGLPERFVQTLTALLGCGVIFSVLLLPLIYSVVAAQLQGRPSGLAAFATVAIFIWWLFAIGHIYRHALGFRQLAPGFAVALGMVLLGVIVVQPLFPETAS